MAVLTFVELQNELIPLDAHERNRARIKRLLNASYRKIYELEPWTFRRAKTTVTVTSGSDEVTGLPTNFGRALTLRRANGDTLRRLDWQDFYRRYYDTTSSSSGVPEHYVELDGALYVGPASNETSSSYQLVYDKAFVALDDDDDQPDLPEGFEIAIALDTQAVWLKRTKAPHWQALKDELDEMLAVMRAEHLETLGDQWPADPDSHPIDVWR